MDDCMYPNVYVPVKTVFLLTCVPCLQSSPRADTHIGAVAWTQSSRPRWPHQHQLGQYWGELEERIWEEWSWQGRCAWSLWYLFHYALRWSWFYKKWWANKHDFFYNQLESLTEKCSFIPNILFSCFTMDFGSRSSLINPEYNWYFIISKIQIFRNKIIWSPSKA